MKSIDIFVQSHSFSDIIVLAEMPTTTLGEILKKLGETQKLDVEVLVFQEDHQCALDLEAAIEDLLPVPADEEEPGCLRLHVGHCRKVAVSVRFNGEIETRHFPSAATIARVHRWAARRAFDLPPRDAAEHVLQIQGATTRPDRDTHIGTLTEKHNCSVGFDLVPCKRVEG